MSFLDTLFRIESGGQNIANTHQTTTSGQAQGYFQITTGTWKEFGGPALGYPTPILAPYPVQAQIASKIPLSRWDPVTINALRNAGYKVDKKATLGDNLAANGDSFTRGGAKVRPSLTRGIVAGGGGGLNGLARAGGKALRDYFVAGDSIGHGLQQAMKSKGNTKDGIPSADAVARVEPGHSNYLFSVGSNDVDESHRGIAYADRPLSNPKQLADNLAAMKAKAGNGEVTWVLPANKQAAAAVAAFAKAHGDRTVPVGAVGKDGVHPISYQKLAAAAAPPIVAATVDPKTIESAKKFMNMSYGDLKHTVDPKTGTVYDLTKYITPETFADAHKGDGQWNKLNPIEKMVMTKMGYTSSSFGQAMDYIKHPQALAGTQMADAAGGVPGGAPPAPDRPSFAMNGKPPGFAGNTDWNSVPAPANYTDAQGRPVLSTSGAHPEWTKDTQSALVRAMPWLGPDFVTGKYDELTKGAVMALQEEAHKSDPHILVDGIVGPQTHALLDRVSSGGLLTGPGTSAMSFNQKVSSAVAPPNPPLPLTPAAMSPPLPRPRPTPMTLPQPRPNPSPMIGAPPPMGIGNTIGTMGAPPSSGAGGPGQPGQPSLASLASLIAKSPSLSGAPPGAGISSPAMPSPPPMSPIQQAWAGMRGNGYSVSGGPGRDPLNLANIDRMTRPSLSGSPPPPIAMPAAPRTPPSMAAPVVQAAQAAQAAKTSQPSLSSGHTASTEDTWNTTGGTSDFFNMINGSLPGAGLEGLITGGGY